MPSCQPRLVDLDVVLRLLPDSRSGPGMHVVVGIVRREGRSCDLVRTSLALHFQLDGVDRGADAANMVRVCGKSPRSRG
jgi:hypothetical protein